MLQEASEITLDYLSKRENRIAYIKARKLAAHEKAVIEQAVDEAVEEAKKQADEEKKKIVINLNKLKMPINKIMEVTNLTQQEVEAFLA